VPADVFPDSVLAYDATNEDDPNNPYVIIQYTVASVFYSLTHLGQFQIYLFKNGDIGYIYNLIYAWPRAKGADAVVGKLSGQMFKC
jgi:hypothetical protein